MLAKVLSATPRGVGALFVTVEVDRIRAQTPSVTVVGLPDTAVREAKDRVFAAIRRVGHRFESANVVINLAPADEKKEGAALDLAMAVGFLAAAGYLPGACLHGRLLLGELSLEGRLQPMRGVLPVALAARERGLEEIIVPAANAHEARSVSGLEVVAAPTLGQVVEYLRDGNPPENVEPPEPAEERYRRSCRPRSTRGAAVDRRNASPLRAPVAGRSLRSCSRWYRSAGRAGSDVAPDPDW